MKHETNNGVFTQQKNVDAEGNIQDYMTAIPMSLTCEANGCGKTEGIDYKRKKASKGGEDEPIFLCKEHGQGYEPINAEL